MAGEALFLEQRQDATGEQHLGIGAGVGWFGGRGFARKQEGCEQTAEQACGPIHAAPPATVGGSLWPIP